MPITVAVLGFVAMGIASLGTNDPIGTTLAAMNGDDSKRYTQMAADSGRPEVRGVGTIYEIRDILWKRAGSKGNPNDHNGAARRMITGVADPGGGEANEREPRYYYLIPASPEPAAAKATPDIRGVGTIYEIREILFKQAGSKGNPNAYNGAARRMITGVASPGGGEGNEADPTYYYLIPAKRN